MDKKQLIFKPEDVFTYLNGTVTIIVRVDGDIKIGDYFSGAKVIALEAYEHSLDTLHAGMTGLVTFDKMPSVYFLHEDSPAMVEYIEKYKKSTV